MNPKECIDYLASIDSDAIIYMGSIDRLGYDAFCEAIPKQKRKHLLLILGTFGGDPNAGYRIARAAIHNYEAENFTIVIPEFCKSAGTLICIGATKLVIFDKGELGPLDVQIQKQDEIFQLSSGLDIIRGMSYLQNEAMQSFKAYLMEINGGSGLSTTIASEICSNLVTGLYEPLFAQIDPVKLGEMSAALQIAKEYGSRLDDKSKALKKRALSRLIHDYPAHGFVIDRAEARTLFNSVEAPDQNLKKLGEFVWNVWGRHISSNRPYVLDLAQVVSEILKENENEEGNETSGNDESSDVPNGSQGGSEDGGSLGKSSGEHEEKRPSVRDESENANSDAGTSTGKVMAQSKPHKK